jgi:hypothetical protein
MEVTIPKTILDSTMVRVLSVALMRSISLTASKKFPKLRVSGSLGGLRKICELSN